MPLKKIQTTCCIAGGGPAGIMLGFLLARAGIEVIVIEKHKDFFRDFRGDTIHPSTFNLMSELGLLKEFLKVPHQDFKEMSVLVEQNEVKIADFRHLKTAHAFLGLMPQWDFLNFLVQQAKEYPGFKLMMETEVKDLIESRGTVKGIKAQTRKGSVEIEALLVIGADGRSSVVREAAKLKIIDFHSAVDVLWFKLSRNENETNVPFFQVHNGRILVLFSRDKYYQCGYVLPKNGTAKLKSNGLIAFKGNITEAAPMVADRIDEIKNWEDFNLLTVKIDRLKKWYKPGLLCIGDAAHAMSPVGGVGINLAVQDAVAAANILYPYLKDDKLSDVEPLKAVQNRREFPTAVTQRLQRYMQDNILKEIISREKATQKTPLLFRLFKIFPYMHFLTARWFGLGIRQEHVQTPEVK